MIYASLGLVLTSCKKWNFSCYLISEKISIFWSQSVLISYNNIETFGQDADDGVDSTVDSSGYPLAANQCLHDNDDYEVAAGEDPQVHREQASEVSFSTIIYHKTSRCIWIAECKLFLQGNFRQSNFQFILNKYKLNTGLLKAPKALLWCAYNLCLTAFWPLQVESGCVQSSQYDDSSAESEDEDVLIRPINILACHSQGNSNDAISTSGNGRDHTICLGFFSLTVATWVVN